jgi:sugar transferase (PEP-CTERM system associated)
VSYTINIRSNAFQLSTILVVYMRRILGHYMATSWLLLGVLEASLIAAGCYAAFYYRFSAPGSSATGVAPFAILLSLGIIGLMHSGGLYRGDSVLNLRRALWRIGAITVPIFILAVWTTGELARNALVRIYPYRWQWTLGLTAVWVLSVIFLRLLFREVHRGGLLTRRVLLVGMHDRAAALAALASESDDHFRIVGHLGLSEGSSGEPSADLATFATQLRASEIVIAGGNPGLPWGLLAHCRISGIRVTDYLDFYEREGRRICIESLREDWVALADGFTTTTAKEWIRRSVDIVLSTIGFIAVAPVLLLTVLAIKLGDGGSVFYRQERVGLWGKPFWLYKFRSMREDAEKDGTPAWAAERDMRITHVGRIIRKLRIDELPQLWNVMRGDMTLVGPRPERPYFVQQFSKTIPFYDYRHALRPGITGWAQVSFRYGASVEDTKRKLSYDLYYIKNRSIFLDVVILLKTVGVVLRGDGAR